MKNYHAYESGFFEIELNEISNLEKSEKMNMGYYDINLARVRHLFGNDIIEFTLKKLPRKYKRSGMDSSELLVIRRVSGSYYAKRHNNSNRMNIQWK